MVASPDHRDPAGAWSLGTVEQFGHRSVYLSVVLVSQANSKYLCPKAFRKRQNQRRELSNRGAEIDDPDNDGDIDTATTDNNNGR